MSEGRSNPERAVRALVDAARRVASTATSDGLVEELTRTTGLSREGVELALDRHLETQATDEELRQLVAAARVNGPTRCVHVLLSANVFVGALRAIALARAVALEQVFIRPSSREPAFARALVAAARDPVLRIVDEVPFERLTEGELHVYGRDATIAEVRARLRSPSVRVRAHGSGMGVAIVQSGVSLTAAARSLADDVVPFDQRGCLSPRVAFVVGADARAFALALVDALDSSARTTPMGEVADAERAEARRWQETARFAGELFSSAGGSVALVPRVILGPPGRNVTVVPLYDESELREALGPWADATVCVGLFAGSTSPALRAMLPPGARVTTLGAMQRPPLDGPVDRRRATA